MKSSNNCITKTEGLIAAPFTPFDTDGRLNTSIIPAYANWLEKEDVVGAFICGTTGEGPSLTTQERLKIAEAWVNTHPRNLRIIVHVGHNSLQDAQILASHAVSIGANAIASMPPHFFKPRNIEEITSWCEKVAEAAPELPFFYYHIPSMSGVYVKVAELMPVLATRIPNFTGVKFTYEDLEDFSNCLQFEGGKYDILFGRDEKLLSALEAGATGAVGSTYNFAAPIYHRIISALKAGDQDGAALLQKRAVQMIDLCIKNTWHPIAAFKSLMESAGLDCGPPRLPIPCLSSDQKLILMQQLKEYYDAELLHRNEPIDAN